MLTGLALVGRPRPDFAYNSLQMLIRWGGGGGILMIRARGKLADRERRIVMWCQCTNRSGNLDCHSCDGIIIVHWQRLKTSAEHLRASRACYKLCRVPQQQLQVSCHCRAHMRYHSVLGCGAHGGVNNFLMNRIGPSQELQRCAYMTSHVCTQSVVIHSP